MEGEQRIRRQILRALKKRPMAFWELINYQDAHLVEFFQVIQGLLKEGLVTYEGGRLSLAGDVDLRPLEDTL